MIDYKANMEPNKDTINFSTSKAVSALSE